MAASSLRKLGADDLLGPSVRRSGALSARRDGDAVLFYRLPDQAFDQMPVAMARVVGMPAGVCLEFDSDTAVLEVEAKVVVMYAPPLAPWRTAFDLEIDGEVRSAEPFSNEHWVLDKPNGRVASVRQAGAQRVRFDGLGTHSKTLRLWLPHNAIVYLMGLYLDTGSTLKPPPPDLRPRWVHYGSSISQCFAADRPTRAWPVLAARSQGWRLQCLGFAGHCHLHGFVAETIAALDADFISLEIGMNSRTDDTQSAQAFEAMVRRFLSCVRSAHPDTGILVISPIYSAPSRPLKGRNRWLRRLRQRFRQPLPTNIPFTRMWLRDLLAGIVNEARCSGDEALYFMDGMTLFGESDQHLLMDRLHPNAEGYALMGERFAAVLSERSRRR